MISAIIANITNEKILRSDIVDYNNNLPTNIRKNPRYSH